MARPAMSQAPVSGGAKQEASLLEEEEKEGIAVVDPRRLAYQIEVRHPPLARTTSIHFRRYFPIET